MATIKSKSSKPAKIAKPPALAKRSKHYTASVFVLTDTLPARTLLLHHRKFDKWMAPGGHQEAHENPVETAIREVQEETGIDISLFLANPMPVDEHARLIPLPKYLLEEDIPAHGKETAHHHIDQIYVITIPEQIATFNQAESHGIGWFSLEETEQLPTFENVRMILRQELSK